MVAFPVSLHSACVGLGFALGFGWLWFLALQARWLPETLWGTPLYGGGGLSLAFLFLGFMAFSFWGDRIATSREKYNRLHPCHIVHGASLVLLAAAVLPAWSVTGFVPYVPVVFIAALGLCQGIYWGGALLALPPKESVAAFLISALAQAGLSLLYQAVPGRWIPSLMICSVAAAWVAAHQRARLALNQTCEPRRSRGRPSKVQQIVSAGSAQGYSFPYLVLGAAFAVLIVGEALLQPSPATALSFFAFLTVCGATAGFLFCRHLSPYHLLGLPLALVGLTLVFFPGARWNWMVYPLAEGIFYFPALLLLTQSPLVRPAVPAQRAACCLGSLLALSFFVSVLSRTLYAPQVSHIVTTVSGVFALLLALVIPLYCNRSRAPEASTSAMSPLREKHESCLTRRELDILGCLKKNMTDTQIAEYLGIKEATVRYHLANMFRKTGYKTRAKLITFWQEIISQSDGT